MMDIITTISQVEVVPVSFRDPPISVFSIARLVLSMNSGKEYTIMIVRMITGIADNKIGSRTRLLDTGLLALNFMVKCFFYDMLKKQYNLINFGISSPCFSVQFSSMSENMIRQAFFINVQAFPQASVKKNTKQVNVFCLSLYRYI